MKLALRRRIVTSPKMIAYAIGCLCLLFHSAAAMADIDKSGAYISAIGGANFLGDQSIDAFIDNTSSTGNTSFSASYIVGFAVGYRFANNWSIEEEVVFRRNTLDRATLTPGGEFSDGNFENTQLSAKALYHFPLRANNDVEAYLGGSVVWLSELDFDLETQAGEQPFEDDRFGFELHAGVRYQGWKHAYVGAGLRYLVVRDADLPSPADGSDRVTLDYDPLGVALEFGWRF
ncbi:MAG: outer membrane beta-barrel protein [Gammaproteobacteria bacterium]